MATYFLHLHECGTVSEDMQGHDFASLERARDYALQAARDIMSAEVREGRLCMSCRIVIVDAQEQPVSELRFCDAIKISGL